MADNQSASPIASYGYDTLGRRSYRTFVGTTTRYSYNGRQILAESDGSGTLLRKFIDGPGIDEPICMLMYNAQGTETGRVFYHFDALGSVIALSQYNTGNGYASIVERYAYSAFGQTQILAPNSELRTTSLFGNPYMFTGRRLDVETRSGTFSGLYDYRARFYSPDLGRFLQPDPIGYGDGMNVYAYCGNNPVNWIDPWGLCKEDDYYDLGETQDIINKAKKNWSPADHSGGGGLDFINTGKQFEVMINGKLVILQDTEFGNYIAGYMGVYHLGPEGYVMIRAYGNKYANDKDDDGSFLGYYLVWIRGDDKESIRDINRGAIQALKDHPIRTTVRQLAPITKSRRVIQGIGHLIDIDAPE